MASPKCTDEVKHITTIWSKVFSDDVYN